MTASLTPDSATFAWDDLAERLERFIATWEQASEPTLAEFLPAEPPAHRKLVLVELIKVDLEQRTTRGCPKRLADYSTEFPELSDEGEPPCDLIYEEYHIRRLAGEAVSPREYYERFPQSAEALRRLMGTDEYSATTQLGAGRRIAGLAAGQRLDDFDLILEVGKGAFGSVFLARQVSMQRLVALKVSADRGNEPQALATLEHPNIVRVYDQRVLAEQKVRLLYMQFAAGGTLAEVVRKVHETPPQQRSGALLAAAVNESLARTAAGSDEAAPWQRRLAGAPWPATVCRLGIQLAQALDYAHRQGILHRDVKPANVLLANDGTPTLADFNISFCSQLDGATPAAYFGGSLAYMSPEQIEACNPDHARRAEDLDGKSDLYGLAVVLWELLYGERPFSDEQLAAGWTTTLHVMAGVRRAQSPAAPRLPHDPLMARMTQALRKALSPELADRYEDGAALARELALCLSPRAWDLVHDLGSGWRDFARRHPVLALFPVNMPPFLLAGAFNLWFNTTYFVPLYLSPREQHAFWLVTGPLNAILYSLGSALVVGFAMPVARSLGRLLRGEKIAAEELLAARRRALSLGHGVAAVGFSLWIIAGIAFPLSIHALVGSFPAGGYVRFMLSMLACGIISCCLPFLAMTWLSVRVFFPALLAGGTPDAAEQQQLAALARYAGYYLFSSPVAPLLALLLVLFAGPDTRAAMVVLVLVAIAGFAAAYAAWQRILMDLAALSVATRPAETIGMTTDTVDTF